MPQTKRLTKTLKIFETWRWHGIKFRSKVKFKSKWNLFKFYIRPVKRKIKGIFLLMRLLFINHKKFQLSRIDADIEKYSEIPILDESINQYFQPENCKLCITYALPQIMGIFKSSCTFCCFASPSGTGCVDKFPHYKKLIDLFFIILKDAAQQKKIANEIRQEFLELWEYRRNFYIKVKEILKAMPKSRFSIRKFKYFPELWSLDHA